MRQVALLVVLVACKSPAGDDYPVNPNDNSNSNSAGDASTAGDAAVVVDGATTMTTGRVCVLLDPRDITSCRATGTGALHVTLGTSTATTDDTGAFTLPTPSGTNLLWHVTGTSLQTSVMPFGTSTTIPALLAADYLSLEVGNGVNVQTADQGEIFVAVRRAGAAVTGAHGASSPMPFYGVLYDTNIAAVWNINAAVGTGAHGMLWYPATPIGTASISVTPMGSTTAVTTPNVPVESQAITYIAVTVP